ncbi:hypothetical protein SLEP1_g19093 [Rubroshorea leprosula]|nr:hypothetical protein SLEP1_g19093 [Rubroshorea leprosula]
MRMRIGYLLLVTVYNSETKGAVCPSPVNCIHIAVRVEAAIGERNRGEPQQFAQRSLRLATPRICKRKGQRRWFVHGKMGHSNRT